MKAALGKQECGTMILCMPETELLRAFWCVAAGTASCRASDGPHIPECSSTLMWYLLNGSGAGKVQTVVSLCLTVADDEQEVLV